MAYESISQKNWEINRHFEIIDDLTEYISKTKALTEMALNCNFDTISGATVYHYFWELDSLINVIETVFEELTPYERIIR